MNEQKIGQGFISRWQKTLGLSAPQASEALISAGGVLVAMSALVIMMHWLYPSDWPWLLIASFGASAIIVFASPHAPMAQPWSLIMGQLVAGTSGMASWLWLKDPLLAIPVGVTLALVGMLVLQCRHAPGGATALFFTSDPAVVDSLQWTLVWGYLLPGLVVIMVLAILYNAPFSWRRYPLIWATSTDQNRRSKQESRLEETLTHEDLVAAQKQLRHYFEMSEAEFMALYRLARAHHRQNRKKDLEVENTDPS
ncbi:MAG: HPP family protein [Hydrogenovibrio sp.]|uniref:HPP family protein n=1 Tax=Hydrogenovibrio sp. TaxID=2065821 RepID=UPI002870964D|nr:HPP family protein [Hydrogenovibrio sp.]MDR9498732.1 HPP family protein [Hydrogenovibrio sp.]